MTKPPIKTPRRLTVVRDQPEPDQPPRHLRPATKRWFTSVVETFELEPHHVRLLTLAAQSWDRAEQAREALAEHGLTTADRYGGVRARPEVAIERDAKLAFARLLRELDLDTPEMARPPALRSNRRGGGYAP